MTRRDFITSVASGAAAWGLQGCLGPQSGPAGRGQEACARRPNILFIFPDEFRQMALGAVGADPVVTPHLDRLAAESRILTRALSNCPVCSPYRAMLFTGKYPLSNGVVTNCNSQTAIKGVRLKEDEICLTDGLHRGGYSVGYIGKWHLDAPNPMDEAFTEGQRGDGVVWDTYTPPGPARHSVGFWYAYGCCDRHLTPHYWTWEAKVNERIDVEDWSPRHEAQIAIDFIRNRDGRHRDASKPFALFIAHNPPHMPFDQVPREYIDRYEGQSAEQLLTRPNVDRSTPPGQVALKSVKNYFAQVTGVDDQIGRVLAVLAEEGLQDDTIVVFTSDHGEMMGSHGLMHKSVFYDEFLLVPFLIRWPGHLRPGRDDLVLNVPDLMPTLMGLAGLGHQIPAGVEGVDLSEVLLGQSTARPLSGPYLMGIQDLPNGLRGVRTQSHTYVIERRPGAQERIHLYDTETDPYQMKNLAGTDAALDQRCRAELQRWLDQTGDPFKL